MDTLLVNSREWRLLAQCGTKQTYTHLHSQDLCETCYVPSLSMKQIDEYTSREIYTYPYCPKIYKTCMGRPNYSSSEVLFDLNLVVESVPFRLGDNHLRIQDGKIADIVKGFSYLSKRYGPFRVTDKMVGFTKEGVVKAWLNEDYGSNKIDSKLLNQKEMTESLVSILKKYGLLEKTKPASYSSLKELLECMKKKGKSIRQVYFEEMKDQTQEELDQQLILREFKTSQNLQKGKKVRKIRKQDPIRKKQNENCDPNDFSFSSLRVGPSLKKSFYFISQKGDDFRKTALNFTKSTKEIPIQRPKSEIRLPQKGNKAPYKAINYIQQRELSIKSCYQRPLKKSSTEEDLMKRSNIVKSVSLQSNISTKDFHHLSPLKNVSKQHQKRPKSAVNGKLFASKAIVKDKQFYISQKSSTQRPKTTNGETKQSKSLQQTLQQDFDALFVSETILPAAIDHQTLKQELDAVL